MKSYNVQTYVRWKKDIEYKIYKTYLSKRWRFTI